MGSFHDDMQEMRDRKKQLEAYGMSQSEVTSALNVEFENYVFRTDGDYIKVHKVGVVNHSSEWSL